MLPVKHFCFKFCMMLLAAVRLSSCADAKNAQIASLENKIVLLEDQISILESQVADQKKMVYTIEYSDPAGLYKQARIRLQFQ